MATMISEVYDALREVGVSEEKARKAAEAMASHEPEFARIHAEITDVRGDIRLLKWQTGALFALIAAITGPTLWLVLRVAAKIGALPA